MPFIKYIKRVYYLDYLIRNKATGNVSQLARKLNLSERAVLNYISAMKDLGFPIKYSRSRNCYYYQKEGKLTTLSFSKEPE